MLEELSSALSNYYRTPSYKYSKTKNLVLVPIKNDNLNERYQNENIPSNGIILNNYAFNLPKTPNFYLAPFNNNNGLYTPNYQNNVQKNFLNGYNINNYNNNLKIRPKSAVKSMKNQNNIQIQNNNANFTFNPNNFSNYNNNKISNRMKKNKSSLIKKINNKTNIDDDYDINHNMTEFENIVNSININGFNKLKDEINDKKIIIAQLENSIAILKNKICISKSNLYSGIHKETKNRIKYENMLCVSNRFKNSGKTADNYKIDINNFRNKIDAINDNTLEIKKMYLNEQNYIDIMKEEIKKGNKGVSDKQKEIENILPALQLLKNHISSIKQKIVKYNNIKRNYIEELSYMDKEV